MTASVTLINVDPSIQRVSRAPATVAGAPHATLQMITRRSANPPLPYRANATSVPGTVAGSGEAIAMIGGTPISARNGVAIAEPPFPNRPPR